MTSFLNGSKKVERRVAFEVNVVANFLIYYFLQQKSFQYWKIEFLLSVILSTASAYYNQLSNVGSREGWKRHPLRNNM